MYELRYFSELQPSDKILRGQKNAGIKLNGVNRCKELDNKFSKGDRGRALGSAGEGVGSSHMRAEGRQRANTAQARPTQRQRKLPAH